MSKLATKWFADNERALATTIGSLALPLGCIMGMVLGPMFILDSDKEDVALGVSHIENYMFISATIVSACCVPMLLFFKEKPNHYPSKAAISQNKTQFNFWSDIKLLRQNINYFWISLCFMMCYGVYTCLGAIISNLVEKYEYTGTETSIFGATFILCGLVGSFIFSYMLDKY